MASSSPITTWARWIRTTITGLLPSTVVGRYPQPTGWLYWVDSVFGIALVGYSEEVVFRR
jgi:hypothetical protein